jgi:hypothetical protein
MSAPPKLRGNTQSEVTRLKKLWLGWSDAEREAWRALFSSDTTQAAIRQRLKVEVGITLKSDGQLTGFRSWVQEQADRDAEAERQADDERRLAELHPDWTAEQLRAEVIAATYRRALATGDFKLGLQTVTADQKERLISLDREKFEHLKAQAAQAGATEQVLDDAALTPEQRAQRIKEIYGRA